jgi:hypothetical protein
MTNFFKVQNIIQYIHNISYAQHQSSCIPYKTCLNSFFNKAEAILNLSITIEMKTSNDKNLLRVPCKKHPKNTMLGKFSVYTVNKISTV